MAATTYPLSDTRPAPSAALALVLALLAVPGVTVAWALPAGGLWVGVPLALGAIVRARRVRAASFLARERRLAHGAELLALAAIIWIPVCMAFVD